MKNAVQRLNDERSDDSILGGFIAGNCSGLRGSE